MALPTPTRRNLILDMDLILNSTDKSGKIHSPQVMFLFLLRNSDCITTYSYETCQIMPKFKAHKNLSVLSRTHNRLILLLIITCYSLHFSGVINYPNIFKKSNQAVMVPTPASVANADNQPTTYYKEVKTAVFDHLKTANQDAYPYMRPINNMINAPPKEHQAEKISQTGFRASNLNNPNQDPAPRVEPLSTSDLPYKSKFARELRDLKSPPSKRRRFYQHITESHKRRTAPVEAAYNEASSVTSNTIDVKSIITND